MMLTASWQQHTSNWPCQWRRCGSWSRVRNFFITGNALKTKLYLLHITNQVPCKGSTLYTSRKTSPWTPYWHFRVWCMCFVNTMYSWINQLIQYLGIRQAKHGHVIMPRQSMVVPMCPVDSKNLVINRCAMHKYSRLTYSDLRGLF